MKPSATFTMLVTLALGVAGLAAAPAALAAPAAGPVALAQTFDNVGITSSSQTQNGDLDGTGDSFDSAALARDGIRPSASFVHDGLTLRWPGVPPGQKDNVLADGQQIALQRAGQHARRGGHVHRRGDLGHADRDLHRRQHHGRHGERGQLGEHLGRGRAHRRRVGSAGHHRRLESPRLDAGQPVLPVDPHQPGQGRGHRDPARGGQRGRAHHAGHARVRPDRGHGGRPGQRRAGRPVLLRPGPQGLRGDGPQQHLQDLVHGGGRDAVRRLLPDRRQHQRAQPGVPGHRRVELHRHPAAGHDIHGQRARGQRPP